MPSIRTVRSNFNGVRAVSSLFGGVTNTVTLAGGNLGSTTALDDLTDVTLTSPAKNDILQFNGSAWVNSVVSGTGTVTSVSVTSANGFAGTVATATTTPAITLTTSITGVLKGNGTAISAAVAGTDYENPLTFTTGLSRATDTISLADTAVTKGSYGSASAVATFTVDAQGRLTAAGSTTIAIAAGAVSGLATVATSGAYSDLSGTPTIPSAIFSTIAVSGQDDVVADSATDTVTFAGVGITITTNKTTDTVTFTGFDGAYSSLSGIPSTFTPASHVHGNITNAGAIGSTANLPLITTTSGVVTVGTFGTGSTDFCVGNDSRLSDARTPTTHATSHQSGGSDAIKLDDLAAPDDNTDLNATASAHGLLPKLSNSATEFLNGKGAWATPAGGSASNSFETISVSGQDDVVADSSTDTLTLVAGSGITITNDKTTDSITIAASGSITIPTGNTLWVDVVNGNDGTGTSDRQDLPYLTLAGALADAASGDLIHVRPGAYTVTASLAADGVNWHFEAGATVTQSTGGSAGIFDDGGNPMTYVVTGYGSFSLTENSTSGFGIFHITSGSVVRVHCCDLTTSGSVEPPAILCEDGVIDVTCRDITSGSSESGVGVKWVNGNLTVRGRRCFGGQAALWSACSATPTGDFYASFDEVVSGIYALWETGSDTTAAWWVDAKIVRGTVNTVVSCEGANRTYLNAQKIFGLIYNKDTAAGQLYVRAFKHSAVANGSGSVPSLIYHVASSTLTAWYEIQHYDVGSYTGESLKFSGGTTRIIGGSLTGGASAKGLELTAGTLTCQGIHLSTSANSSTRPVTKSGGTLTLTNCTLIAEGTVDSVYAASGQTVNVGGVLTVNRPVNANITLAGGPLLRSDTSTIVSPTFSNPTVTGNVNLSNTSTLVFQDGAGDNTVTFGIPNADRTNSTQVNWAVEDAAATYTVTIGGNVTLTAGTTIVSGGALGTPSSGTVTNLTGTASININGTVGATTPTTGVFTTLVAGSATSILVGTAGSAVGSVGFRNATSGTATLTPPTGALGTYTVTLPNAASTLPIFGQQVTFTGPSTARTYTLPDANSTLAQVGRSMIPIMAAGMSPSASGGCAELATIASAANQPDIQTLDFDATTQEYAQFTIPMPESWDEGTVTFIPIWSHASTTTNFGVVWDLQAVAVSNDDGIAVAFGTAQTSTDTGGTTNDIYFGPESSAITVSGTPAAGDLVCFRISRVTGNGSDTMAIDARLHGIRLYFTTNSGVDT